MRQDALKISVTQQEPSGCGGASLDLCSEPRTLFKNNKKVNGPE